MAQALTISGDVRQTWRTILDGQSVRVWLWWQPVDEHWYVSLAWLDRRPILSGVRLLEDGTPMRGLVTDFKGEIVVEGRGTPGRQAWSTTHRLIYLAPNEL